jgi:hypothetical protein
MRCIALPTKKIHSSTDIYADFVQLTDIDAQLLRNYGVIADNHYLMLKFQSNKMNSAPKEARLLIELTDALDDMQCKTIFVILALSDTA